MSFRTDDGMLVPAVTADGMREVDRIAMEEFGLGILQMMENAGRNLAQNAVDMLDGEAGPVTILAGGGGNGGGGLCCGRHLHNRGYEVHLVLDRDPSAVHGAASAQLRILEVAGLQVTGPDGVGAAMRCAQLVVDALIGYSLRGAPRGRAAELIAACNRHGQVLSLDVPSGLDATTGEAPGAVVQPERTLTLALPKTGLSRIPGDLYLADIGIPPAVYERLGLSYQSPFQCGVYWTHLLRG
jgi:NAD(P)H-hydrate epimerase